MAENNPNPNDNGAGNGNGAGGGKDGGNANQGGGNSQGQGGNQGGNQGGQHQGGSNQGGNNQGGNQAGGEDFKVKFGESTKENQRIMDILKKNGIDPKTGKKVQGAGDGGASGEGNQGGGDAGATFFSDEELEATFPSYSTMSDQEKQVLRQVGSFPKMARMVAEMHDKLTFNEQLEVLVADPANKVIADNMKEFKEFAYADGNLKIPMEVLVDAFMGKKLRGQGGNNNGGGGNNQNQGGGNQRQGMEGGTNGQGSGGGDGVQEMSAEAARDLRLKEPRKYNALARAGKIKIVSGN